MSINIELIRIGVDALTPLSIAVFGSIVSYQLKALEQKQWGGRYLTEKRASVFEEISPKLNKILCYSLSVGQWQSLDAKTVIDLKREVDARIHGHKFLLGAEVYNNYKIFTRHVFDTNDSDSGSTRLKTVVHESRELAREGSAYRAADQSYVSRETVEERLIKHAYDELGKSFIDSLNIFPGRLKYAERER